MAKSTFRIRFTFNQQEGDLFNRQAKQKVGKDFAAVIVEDFAIRYAEDTFKQTAKTLEANIAKDVKRELRHMALMFRRHIIGAAPTKASVSGTLDTVIPSVYGEDAVPVRASLPQWAERSEEYLARKKKRFKHTRWFERQGLLNSKMKTENWIQAFGPIKVEFQRFKNPTMRTRTGMARYPVKMGPDGHVHVAVGRIRVFALTYITPAMLPALRTGDPTTMNSDNENDELMLLVQAGMGDEIAYRLGQRSAEISDKRYRPTLEPFLAFYLTRAVPNAVAARISNTLGSSAGRTRR